MIRFKQKEYSTKQYKNLLDALDNQNPQNFYRELFKLLEFSKYMPRDVSHWERELNGYIKCFLDNTDSELKQLITLFS